MKYTWNTFQGESEDLVQNLLQKRGFTTPEQVRVFLSPDWDAHTHDPFLFTQMKPAVARVFVALENEEHIVIHGDYDADGVSGTTLLFSALSQISEKLGVKPRVEAFLPDREKDGYGVALHTVERLGKEKVDLLLTVDCGIANAKELNRAHELGMDVIICDHHQMGEALPEHALIIHPLAPGEDYPNKTLCGTGVAFKLASALFIEARQRGLNFPVGHEKWFLDLVAIATVTDVMPILGENRVLEKYGLLVLNKTRRAGLRKIVEVSRATMGQIDTQAIGFQIGPRINAAGRIKSAEVAFKALSATDEETAQKYANELELLNRERQRVSDAAFREARSMVKARKAAPVHVVWNETWNPGVVGLIAGKLVTEFGVPAFALTRVDDHFVGSGRSIGGLHLVEAMKACGDIFVKAGGHPQACGLTIAEEHLETFATGLATFAKDYFKGDAPKPTLEIDAEVSLSQVNWDLYNALKPFEPFGEGNPRPRFLSSRLQVVTAEMIGKTRNHLLLNVNPKDGDVRKMIGFGFGEWARRLAFGDLIDVVYEVDVNEWNGNRELQCRVIDLRLAEQEDLD